MTASRPSDSRTNRGQSRLVRIAPRSRADRTRVIGIIFAAIVVCAMVVGGVLPVMLDRMNQDPSAGPPPPPGTTSPSEFEQELRAEIERQPENPQLMVSLANLLVARGAGDEATTWYEQAVALDPDRIETRLDFGAALTRRGSLSDAEVQFQRALAIDANHADAWYQLGELYLTWQPQRIDEAVPAFERAVAAAPGSVAAERANEALASLDRGIGSPAASPTGATSGQTTEDGE